MAIKSTDVTVGAGRVLTSPRDGSLVSVTVTAATSATSFTISPTDAAKIRPGDKLSEDAVPAFTAAEAATLAEVVTVNTTTGVVTVSPALPGGTPTATDVLVVAWHERGATDGGIELQGSFEKTKHYVDQSVYPVATTDGERSLKLLAPLAEATIKNIALAFGIEETDGDTLQISSTTTQREDRFLFIGPAPSSKTRFAVIHRGQNNGTASFKAGKGEKTIIALDIEALVDSAMTPDMLDIKDVA